MFKLAKRLVGTPLLLRRLIKSNEQIAKELAALNTILRTATGVITEAGEPPTDEDEIVSYSTDRETFERAQRDRRRFGFSDEE